MAKHTLLVEYDYDFDVIGISCHLKDYRFCWVINQLLNQNLEREEQSIETDQGSFAVYTATCPETKTRLSLIANRSSKGLFIPEHRQVDYVLVVRENALMEAEELVDVLNSDSNVLMAYTIDPERIKSKDYLLMSDI
jgi:hypothetical protein